MTLTEIVAAELERAGTLGANEHGEDARVFRNEAEPDYGVSDPKQLPYAVVLTDPDPIRETRVSLTCAVDVHVFTAEGQREQADALAEAVRDHLHELDAPHQDDYFGLVRLRIEGLPEELAIGSLESSAVRFSVYATKCR